MTAMDVVNGAVVFAMVSFAIVVAAILLGS